jgi:Tol biopolymer transport system component
VTLPHHPAYFPSVSPNGTKLLYSTYIVTDDGGVDGALYAYDFASRTAQLVVRTSGTDYSAMSPDSQTVAYVNNLSLHTIAIDGTNDRTILLGPNDNGTGYGHPIFAADSQTVLYGTGGALGVIRIDGSHDEVLLTEPVNLYPNAAFSPDFQRIVAGVLCDASLPGACASGQLLADVAPSSSFNAGASDPSWGHNGLIAYGSEKDVYVIAETGGAARNMTAAVTGSHGAASDPVWAPGCASIP